MFVVSFNFNDLFIFEVIMRLYLLVHYLGRYLNLLRVLGHPLSFGQQGLLSEIIKSLLMDGVRIEPIQSFCNVLIDIFRIDLKGLPEDSIVIVAHLRLNPHRLISYPAPAV